MIRLEILADSEGLKVRLGIAPSILTQVYARGGLGLFDRSTANVAVELRDQRDGRSLERQPVLVEFVPRVGGRGGIRSQVPSRERLRVGLMGRPRRP